MAWVELRAPLTDDDRAGAHRRAVEDLHAETLSGGVTPVAGRGGTLLLRHDVVPLPLGDPGDLDRRVVLAVAPAAAGVGLVLVHEAVDLRALGLAHDPGGDGGTRQLGRGRQHVRPVDHQDRLEISLTGDK